jgi:predicted DCC family thiol-disulfide oxidoreductase YuxK
VGCANNVGMAALLIYDGDCRFCTTYAMWLAGEWTAPADALSWQQLGTTGLARRGLSPADARETAWWIDGEGRRFRGHRAVAHAMLAAGGWRAVVGRPLLLPPVSWLGRPGFWAVTRWRHHVVSAGGSASTV